eukprot:7358705-Ditylum_brightwellii.AAC.1
MLVIYKTTILNDTAEFKYLQEKSAMFTSALSTCSLQQHETWLSYGTVYCASITYSLGTTLFSKRQVTTFHTMVTPRILPCMGYHFRFPKGVVYVSKFIGGIRMAHLQAYQLSAKITGAIKHIRAQTKIGQQCTILIRWAQIFAGTKTPAVS